MGLNIETSHNSWNGDEGKEYEVRVAFEQSGGPYQDPELTFGTYVGQSGYNSVRVGFSPGSAQILVDALTGQLLVIEAERLEGESL